HQTRSRSFLLRFLNAQEDLAYVTTGYLLNVHGIRVAPTLSDRFTLRLEPSAFIEAASIRRFLSAMEDVCSRLSTDDALNLTRFFVGGNRRAEVACCLARTDGKPVAYDEPRFLDRQRSSPPTKVAWLCHLIDADDLVSLEPPFVQMSFGERE